MTNPNTLAIARVLFERAKPDATSYEWSRLDDHIQAVLGHTLITIAKHSTNVRDGDGREFGWRRAGTLFGVIDPEGVAYEGVDETRGAGGGRWHTNFTRYEFTQILKRDENLVLVGQRLEFSQVYDEREWQRGGRVTRKVGEYPIEVILKPMEATPGVG